MGCAGLLNPLGEFCWSDLPEWSYHHYLGLIDLQGDFSDANKFHLIFYQTMR